MLKLMIIKISVLIFSTSYAAATSCHDLQQSQLLSLNERMNQMIDTISALLPTASKKPTSLISRTVTPSSDFKPSSPGCESTYYTPPPAYTSPASTPHIVYVTPPVTTVYKQPTSISTPPRQYSPIEPELLSGYTFPPVSNPAPRRVRSQYQYDNYPVMQYQNPMPIAPSNPSSYPSVPYTFVQPTYSTSCNTQYSPEHSYAASRPDIPTYPPKHSPLPLPVYMPPNILIPAYPNQPDLRSALYT